MKKFSKKLLYLLPFVIVGVINYYNLPWWYMVVIAIIMLTIGTLRYYKRNPLKIEQTKQEKFRNMIKYFASLGVCAIVIVWFLLSNV